MSENSLYELILMVRNDSGSAWSIIGQYREIDITDVADMLHCTEDDRFNYLCRTCLDNRSFLIKLKEGVAVSFNDYEDYQTMEIAREL